jgi:hypothetical protein
MVLAGAVVIAVAQLFRASSRSDAAHGRAKVAERDLMLRELEHRMKNNFQTVAALLSTQLRRATDEPAREALREALNRVTSISQAHHNLYAPGDHTQGVEMGVYLGELCDNLAEALLLGELVRLRCNIEPGALDRDRAVAIGPDRQRAGHQRRQARVHRRRSGPDSRGVRAGRARLSADRRGRRPGSAGRLRHAPPGDSGAASSKPSPARPAARSSSAEGRAPDSRSN